MLSACTGPSNRYVYYHSVWFEQPDSLELCDDLRVNYDRTLESANWSYNNLGTTYPYFNDEDVFYSDCTEPIDSGVVRVQRAKAGEVIGDTMSAWAQYHYDYQVIQDPPGSYNTHEYLDGCTVSIGKLNTKWVIRHEFSHCWGWAHTEDDQWTHLMSPWVGHDTEGLEYMPNEDWTNR